MYLSELTIFNYRSCKLVNVKLEKDTPNIFIGVNDCGKTTILKAIGLLLDEKSNFFALKDNSSKKDFSNSPLKKSEVESFLNNAKLPMLPYDENESIIIGKLEIEDGDIDEESLSSYSNQLLWVIENSNQGSIWLAKIFSSNSSRVQTFLLAPDYKDSSAYLLQGWDMTAKELDNKIKELKISSEEISNQNRKGRFSNLEKIRAIYSKTTVQELWAPYKIEKGDKAVFPSFRYLDWNSSFDDIKKIAAEAMAATIEAQLKPLRKEAVKAAETTEQIINEKLASLHGSIAELVPNITAIKTKVYFDVKESVTDILINKVKADGDIHLDLQGEGVKRQIWFALIKSGALASINSAVKNKKFLWAFDEPETHLYPSAQRQFFEIINEVSQSNVQALICTHSTVFIDKSKLKHIKTVYLNNEAYSEYSECSTIDEIFEALELRNSDFLFYDKFLVIEGDTESHLIPELYRLFSGKSLEEDNIQIINLTGKNKWLENKKALENVLRGFKKSFDYVIYLFDADMAHDLGVDAITENFFFVGKQDIEDSISSQVWQKVVEKATAGEVKLTADEIDDLKTSIPTHANVSKKDKFFAALERLVKSNLSQKLGENVTWDVLPSKGSESAAIILEFLKSKDDIPSVISDAFNKLQYKETATIEDLEEVSPREVIQEIIIPDNTVGTIDPENTLNSTNSELL